MTTPFVIGPMLVPLVSVVLTLALRRWPRVQRATSIVGGVAYAMAVALLVRRIAFAPGGPQAIAYQVGGWPAPFGITLVADALSAFMLAIAAAVALPAIAFSVAFIDPENQQVFYHPLFHALVLGLTGAFLTGDLFNLFVWFEVMLMASYVFVAFYGGAQHTAAAFRYLVLNVIGSGLFLLAVGGLYATTGTLNMADMTRRLAAPHAYGIDVAPVVGLAALLLGTFGLKAGLVPFQPWVPAAYRAAPLPVAAMLAGVSKKVGIYAIVRLYFTVFAAMPIGSSAPLLAGRSALAFLGPALFVAGIASIAVGGTGAIARESIEETLAYSSIGQIGFIAVPVAIAAMAGSEALRHLAIVAALVYALQHALSKGCLFLAAATIRGGTGTNRVANLGGLARRSPVLSGAFFVGILSLVGIPPLAGFFGKFLVFEAGAYQFSSAPTSGAIVLAALVLGAVLTIAYTTRLWTRCFWGPTTPSVEAAVMDPVQVGIVALLATVVIVVGVGFEPVAEFADAAANAALERDAYVDAVGPAGGIDA